MRDYGLLIRISATVLSAMFSSGSLAGDEAEFDTRIRPLLRQYCLDCHDAETSEADVDLSSVRSSGDLVTNRRLWRRAWQVIDSHRMPPEEMPQPSAG